MKGFGSGAEDNKDATTKQITEVLTSIQSSMDTAVKGMGSVGETLSTQLVQIAKLVRDLLEGTEKTITQFMHNAFEASQKGLGQIAEAFDATWRAVVKFTGDHLGETESALTKADADANG